MKWKSRLSKTVPTPVYSSNPEVSGADSGIDISITTDDKPNPNMSESNGVLKEHSPLEPSRPTTGRLVSASMMRSVMSSSESSPSSESNQWSSAIGHASTGKSGRVIERLQGDIDRLRREKHLLKVRHEEAEKANETLLTRNQYLEDRNSNYEQSNEANLRQLGRKERQVEELREELRKERLKTSRAEAQAQAAATNEESWRDQASQAKSLAAQKEVEYETIVACRKTDYDRHQLGLDKIRSGFTSLLRRQQDDVERKKKLEILAEQQRQTISQLEEINKKLTVNFRSYRAEIDTAIADLRRMASSNDDAMTQKLHDMTEVTGQMRWVMKVDEVVNGNVPSGHPPIAAHSSRPPSQHQDQFITNGDIDTRREKESGRRSPTKGFLTRHLRKESNKSTK
ncbi:hypothetical protein PV10_07186 [Exophiala mesophila]|uniref:SWI5-dependent HO expression protein 3 n=2 Tax=Exophiala mesophila TaxID=212818 RepID=A0A0D1Z7A8_EXOME|nr:uncharacterized protein PV10_07186 [Exophiala mesophila]KIV89814.1 hypothetical protein PV10_07186 [Exophiala mesophila]